MFIVDALIVRVIKCFDQVPEKAFGKSPGRLEDAEVEAILDLTRAIASLKVVNDPSLTLPAPPQHMQEKLEVIKHKCAKSHLFSKDAEELEVICKVLFES